MLAQGGRYTEEFDKLGKDALDRLFPGLTSAGHTQASLSVRQSGLGCRLASEVALPASLGGLIATRPLVTAMTSDAPHAGLCSFEVLRLKLEETIAETMPAYMAPLAETERVCAEEFVQRASIAADATWARKSQRWFGSSACHSEG
jgi:hypothetical protein